MAESVEADWSNGCFRAEFHFAPVELQLPPDRDRDGIPDTSDNCIDVPNTDQADADGDRLGDACDPNPRIPEEIPESPEEVPERPDDADGDGVPDSEDNCVRDANPLQTDSDGDGRGDACDPRPRQPDPEKPDTDNDGIPDDEDNCPRNPNPRQSDFDRDRLGDACDPNPRIPEEFPERPDDADDDGVPDSEDNCVRDANPLQTDSDGDGRGDACDSVTPWFRIIGGIVLLGLGGFGLYWSYRVRKPPVALSSTSPTAPGIPVWTRYSARMEPRGWWREGIDRMGEPAPTDPEAPGIKFEISFAAQPDAGEGRLETSGLLIVEEREINDDNIT